MYGTGTPQICPYCGSAHITLWSYINRVWYCTSCGRTFTEGRNHHR